MNKQGAICILDGMGPQAGGYLYSAFIRIAIKDFGATNNDDFPEIILRSIPVPDFITSNKNKGRALIMLKDRLKEMSGLNILCFTIACNTAHVLIDELRKNTRIPFISMIDEVVKQIKQDRLSRVGLLATSSTIRYQLYQRLLQNCGIVAIIPITKQLAILESIVRNILSGKMLSSDRKKLLIITKSLRERGAEGIILGCTELPLVYQAKCGLPVYNCVEILVRASLQKYYKQNTIKETYE